MNLSLSRTIPTTRYSWWSGNAKFLDPSDTFIGNHVALFKGSRHFKSLTLRTELTSIPSPHQRFLYRDGDHFYIFGCFTGGFDSGLCSYGTYIVPNPAEAEILKQNVARRIKAEEALSMEKYLIKYRAELEQRIAQAAALLPKVKPVRKARPYVYRTRVTPQPYKSRLKPRPYIYRTRVILQPYSYRSRFNRCQKSRVFTTQQLATRALVRQIVRSNKAKRLHF